MPRIHIYDDDGDVRETLRIILEQAAYSVEEAKNGREAAELYCSSPPDLVITDIHMPEMNGVEIIQEIQKINPRARVIVMSGGGEILPKDKLYMLEVLQVVKAQLEKPLDAKKLLQAVDKVLGNGEMLST